MTEMTTGRDPDVLTTQELAARLGLSPQTVHRMAHARQLPALKTGKDFRYSWETVRDVLRQPHPTQEHSTHEQHHDEQEEQQAQPDTPPGDRNHAQQQARTEAQQTRNT